LVLGNFSLAYLLRVFQFLALASAVPGWVFAAYFYFEPHWSIGPHEGIEYKDFISILLTALGVLIASLAGILALGAIWGYGALKEEMTRVSEAESRKVAEIEAKAVAEGVATRVARNLAEQTLRDRSIYGGDYGEAAGGRDAEQ
jgi:hypothetical protein